MIGIVQNPMRPHFHLFLPLLLLLACGQTPTPEAEATPLEEGLFSDLSAHTLLSTLFDGPILDSSGMALWQPNYYERMSFRVSYDGLCHTSVDTVMYWTDREKRRCACVILATHNFVKGKVLDSTLVEVSDCHFCGVTLGTALLAQQPDSLWQLYRFEKAFTTLGYFGRYRTGRQDAGTISLKQIGDPWTCLSLQQGVGGNGGISTGSERLYSIEQFELGGFPNSTLTTIFGYDFYHEEPLYNDTGIVAMSEQHTEMRILEKPQAYYDIELTTDSNGHRSTRRYTYADDVGQYEQR